MYNTIKKINMEVVYENFCDFDKTKTEKEIEKCSYYFVNSKIFFCFLYNMQAIS